MEDNDTDHVLFCNRLKHFRKHYLGIPQKVIANAIGISTSYYSAIERGDKFPNFHFLKQMQKVFKINLNYLILGEGKPFLGKHPYNVSPNIKPERGIMDDLNKKGFKPKHMTKFLMLLSENEPFLKNVLHTLDVWSQKTESGKDSPDR